VTDPVASSAVLITERLGPRLRCILNRPESHNALNPELLDSMATIIESTAAADDVLVVTIEGAGTRAFSAGFDIKVMAAVAGGPDWRRHALQRATNAVASCPKPTVALIRGFCFGAGFDLAMACDFRLATTESRFAVPAIKLGTVYEPRSIERIWNVLGPTVTKELFMLGREFSSSDALRAGIVQEVVEATNLQEAADRWTTIPPGGVQAVFAHKRIIDAFGATSDRSAEFWAPLDALRQQSLEAKERAAAVDAFTKRRSAAPSAEG